MNCQHAQENLKAYLDGELGRLAAAALRRHLTMCPACRAEMEAVHMLSKRLASLSAPEAPAHLRDAITGAARALRPSAARVRRRVAQWVAAAAAAGGLIAALSFAFLARPVPAQAAFDRMLAATEQVKTCHVRQWLQQLNQPRGTMETWYANGRWRMEHWRGDQQITLQVYDGSKLHSYGPATNTAYLNISEQPFHTPFRGFSVSAMLGAFGKNAEVQLSQVRKDRRRLNQFTVTQPKDNPRERMVIFADPKTDLLLAFEVYGHLDTGWKLMGGSEVIQFNIPVDPELFAFTYPEDAKVVDKGGATEQ